MKKNLLLLLAFIAAFIGTTSAQTWDQTGNAATPASILGTTNAIPLNVYTKNLFRLTVDTVGRVGINTPSPSNLFTVRSSGTTPSSAWASGGNPVFVGVGEEVVGNANMDLLMASNQQNGRPILKYIRSRGTLAAPTAVQPNDFLGSLAVAAFDGSRFQSPAAINIYSDGAATAGNVPARVSIVTGTNSGNALERLRVGNNGNINFNNTQFFLQQLTGNVSIGQGNLLFTTPQQTIQFPTVTTLPNNAMINMFAGGTQNKDRMVIAHSPSYTNWGLQYQDSADKFNFLSGGTPVLTTDLGNWRVGVGTSSPAVRLDIAGSNAWNLATSEGDFRLGNETYRLKMGVANAGSGAGDAYIASSNRLFLGAGNDIGRTQTLSVNDNGRVGIGTYLPSARLEVIGDTITTPVVSARVSYVGSSDVRGMSSYSKPADGWGYGVEATGGFIGGYHSGLGGAYTGTAFGVYGTASGTAGTRIGVYGTASGGTVNNWGGYFPTKTFTSELRVGGEKGATGYVAAINGKLIATEVRVELMANWPDYVFGKGYKLMSIEALEAKINKDKHLPGIPAASEVKENGIMLGEMQTKTIEKVEENTLYIIQLNNKIKELEKKIDDLLKKSK